MPATATLQHTFETAVFASTIEPRWYAAYTRANHEKRVVEHLGGRKIESFLPLYDSVRRWKDRLVRLKRPLFAGYVFVRLPISERNRVLEIDGVVRMVGFGGLPIPLPEGEIEAMRERLSQHGRFQPHPFLTIGRRIQIRSGPLEGLEGILLRRKGRYRLVVSVDLIQCSIVADVDQADVAALPVTNSQRGR